MDTTPVCHITSQSRPMSERITAITADSDLCLGQGHYLNVHKIGHFVKVGGIILSIFVFARNVLRMHL